MRNILPYTLKLLLIISIQINILNIAKAEEVKGEAFERKIVKSYKSLYNFHFNTSRQILDSLQTNMKSNVDVMVLNINYKWWKIISNDTQNNRRNFLTSLDSLKRKRNVFTGEKRKILSIYYYIFYCRYHLMNNNYLKVLLRYGKFDRLIKNFKCQETNYQEKITLIRNFYLYLKHKYMSFNAGKKQRYLKEIKKLADSENIIVKTETNYLLMKIYSEIEKLPDKAKTHEEFLNKKYPNNPFFEHTEKNKISGKMQ